MAGRFLFGSALLCLACSAGDDARGTAVSSGTATAEGGTSMPGTSGEGSTDAPTTTDTPTTADATTSSTTAAESSTTAVAESSTTAASGDRVLLETTLGNIVIELEPELAPVTVANFFAYVDAGFYDGTDGLGATTFHRVVDGFVIQGGGLTERGVTKATMPPIVNESGNGLMNARGTIAMARTNVPDSATSQFFINLVDNFGLDEAPGYAVFGQVVEGLDVVDAIGAVPTTMEVPDEPILITSASRL